MIRILHTADLHLGAPFPSLGEHAAVRQAAFLQTFERLVSLAQKKNVHLFLVAGDLFDSPRPEAALVARVQAGLQRLVASGIVPIVLPGTHDHLVAADSVYRQNEFPGIVMRQATLSEPVAVTVAGTAVHIYGFAYQGAASGDALSGMMRRTGEGVHLGMLHGSRQGSPEWDYRRKDFPFTVEMLRNWKLDYVALGHYHEFDLITDGDRVLACYPGSPEGKRFGENGARHAALVSIGGGRVEVEKVAVNAQELEEKALDLGGCDSNEQAVAAIRPLGRSDLLLRLVLTGTVEAPLDISFLHARCRDAFFHLDLEDRTRLFASAFAQRIEKEETVRGQFVRRARQLIEELPDEERPVVEEAFREVLARFHAFSGGRNG